mmetsp:Transcript_77418/g.160868  ORF Transcript_77418/g.160868 Transcript_77418/m.160868 type:complete len:303 (+) Transcript_77418:7274-8182(+)
MCLAVRIKAKIGKEAARCCRCADRIIDQLEDRLKHRVRCEKKGFFFESSLFFINANGLADLELQGPTGHLMKGWPIRAHHDGRPRFRARPDERLQCQPHVLGREKCQTPLSQILFNLLIGSHSAGNRPQLDAETRETHFLPPLGKGVHEGVGRGVVPLSIQAKRGGNGARWDQHRLEAELPHDKMQVPRAEGLWAPDLGELGLSHVLEKFVCQHPREVEDVVEASLGHRNLEHILDTLQVTHVQFAPDLSVVILGEPIWSIAGCHEKSIHASFEHMGNNVAAHSTSPSHQNGAPSLRCPSRS